MLRAALLFALLAALAAAAAWLAERPGALTLQWGDLRIETSVAVALGLFAVLLFIVLTLHKLWLWLIAGPGAWRAARAAARRRKGYDALTRGLVAVAAGDGREAGRQAQRAYELLQAPPLARLLSAQAAQLQGDEAGAAQQYEALIATPDAEFLGLRGRLALARRAGDRATARKLAERAFELRPGAQWVAEELFHLQAADGDWDAAERTLAKLNGAEVGRRRALALFGRARAADGRGEERAALELARKAHGLLPELAPITAFAARLHAAAGEARKARKLLEDGWGRAPHPELAEVWRQIGEDVAALARTNPEHPESLLLLAEESLRKGERDEARRRLEALAAEAAADARVFRLLADLAEADGDAAAAARWLRRAADAPRLAWRCRACGAATSAWRDVCPTCGAFDTFDWRAESAPPMLPSAAEPAAQLPPPDAPGHVILPGGSGEAR